MKAFPQLIFGYHGCERDVAEDVVMHRDVLRPSENRWDWLGTGTYYWEGAPERARLDCAVVNTSCEYFAGIGRAFDTVRGAFPEGDPVFTDSKILTMTHVQICVRNPEVVVAYFLPR